MQKLNIICETGFNIEWRKLKEFQGELKELSRSNFEKFKQVGDTLTDKPKGTGLGLPICKEILEHYGGMIWVESELGKGSTFILALPVRAAGSAPSSLLPSLERPQALERELSQALGKSLLLLEERQATVEDCLTRYPEYAADLRPLLDIALEVGRAPRPAPSQAAFAAGQRYNEQLRQRLLRTRRVDRGVGLAVDALDQRDGIQQVVVGR